MKLNGEKERFSDDDILTTYISKAMPVAHTADIILP
jgi:hypothetical protein